MRRIPIDPVRQRLVATARGRPWCSAIGSHHQRPTIGAHALVSERGTYALLLVRDERKLVPVYFVLKVVWQPTRAFTHGEHAYGSLSEAIQAFTRLELER